MMRNPYQYYRNQDLDTSSKYEMVERCYAEAALSLRRAEAFIDEKNYEAANGRILKARKILIGMDGALDMKYAVSGQLRQLYGFMQHRLFKANLSKDKEPLEQVAKMLDELRDTWQEALKNYKKIQA